MKRLLLSLSFAIGLQAQEAATLKLTKTIPLAGVKGRFDHLTIDPAHHRLFVAALGNDTLEVVDVQSGKSLKSISGLHQPTGVVFLKEKNQFAAANGDSGTLNLFDGLTYDLVRTVDALSDADNLRLDGKTLLVGYAYGALGFVEVEKMRLTGNIKLSAHPESFQIEQNGWRVFINIPSARQIAVVDREKKAVVDIWPLKDFHANFPMALDETHHRLFIGCRSPARLVVLDITNGGLVSDVPISGDTDDLFYDSILGRLYISCGEGFVDVVEQTDADHYVLKEKVRTRSGARTALFSPELQQLFVAVPKRGGETAQISVYQTVR